MNTKFKILSTNVSVRAFSNMRYSYISKTCRKVSQYFAARFHYFCTGNSVNKLMSTKKAILMFCNELGHLPEPIINTFYLKPHYYNK